jgi:hypothetical protein
MYFDTATEPLNCINTLSIPVNRKVITMFKSRRKMLAGHVAHMGEHLSHLAVHEMIILKCMYRV